MITEKKVVSTLKERKDTSLPLINEQIQFKTVQLIKSDGENMGIVSREKALELADEARLDLVLLTEKGGLGVPVAKIMNFGKILYEKKKKKIEAKKNQKVIQVKEIKMRPKIGEHDYQTKIKQAVQFLNAGKRVKITLFFKGREIVTKNDRGAELFEKINKSFEMYDIAKNLVQEKDIKIGQIWSRIYYIKN